MFDTTEAKRLAEEAGWVPVDQCPEEWKDGREVFGRWYRGERPIHGVIDWQMTKDGGCWFEAYQPVGEPREVCPVPDPAVLATSLRDAVAEIERLREALTWALEYQIAANRRTPEYTKARALLGGDHGHD